jgi:hypothetical protein
VKRNRKRRATEAACVSRRFRGGGYGSASSAQRSRSVPLNVLEITLPLASSTRTPCPEKRVPNKLERTKPLEVIVVVPSLFSTTEKLPPRGIKTKLRGASLARATNLPQPRRSTLRSWQEVSASAQESQEQLSFTSNL